MIAPDRYAPSRRLARRRLAALARAAAFGGVALAGLAPSASAQTAPAAPSEAVHLLPPAADVLDGPVWLLGDDAQAGGFVVNPFGLSKVVALTIISAPSLADFDDDGDLDVLAGTFNGTFAFFENTAGPDASATFAPPKVNPFGLSDVGFAAAPSVGDLDGDGDLDVLSGNSQGNFFFFENTAGPGATPIFAPAQTNPFGLANTNPGSSERSVGDLGDLDGDGDLDVLAGSSLGLLFFENTAGPGAPPAFTAPQANPFGLTDLGVSLSPDVVDLDNDGDLDVLANASLGFYFFENTAGAGATPTFAAVQTIPYGLDDNAGVYSSPAVGDLDGDGDLDVLSGQYFYADFIFFENTAGPGATPAFEGFQENPFGLSGAPKASSRSKPALVDLDSDGDLDVLAGENEGSFVFFENTAGAGAAPTLVGPHLNPYGLSKIGLQSALSVADLDGDGDLDVLAVRSQYSYDVDIDGRFVYFENTAGPGAAPAFAAPQYKPFGLSDLQFGAALGLGDLDGDGDVDVLASNGSGNFFYFPNTAGPGATPAFVGPLTNPFGLSDVGVRGAPTLADLDGDGDLDVLAGTSLGTFAYFRNVTRPGARRPVFRLQPASTLGLDDVGSDSAPAVGDLDGDGVLDVLSGAEDGKFYFFSGVGTGAGRAPAASAGASAASEASLSALSPNPARGAARLTLALPAAEHVRAAVYDALGRQVALVADGELSGAVELTVDTAGWAAGVYVVRVEGETFAESRRLTVTR